MSRLRTRRTEKDAIDWKYQLLRKWQTWYVAPDHLQKRSLQHLSFYIIFLLYYYYFVFCIIYLLSFISKVSKKHICRDYTCFYMYVYTYVRDRIQAVSPGLTSYSHSSAKIRFKVLPLLDADASSEMWSQSLNNLNTFQTVSAVLRSLRMLSCPHLSAFLSWQGSESTGPHTVTTDSPIARHGSLCTTLVTTDLIVLSLLLKTALTLPTCPSS